MNFEGALVVHRDRGPACSLVIGIGNPLRGDDGVGPWLVHAWGQRRARRKAAMGAAPLRIRVVPQLLPELAEELAAVRRVLFVDAWRVAPGAGQRESGPLGSGPRLLPIAAADPRAAGAAGWGAAAWTLGHHGNPAMLLQLTAGLFGQAPLAQSLLLPTTTFAATDPGGGLGRFSAGLQRQLPRAWQLLDHWLRQGAERLEHEERPGSLAREPSPPRAV